LHETSISCIVSNGSSVVNDISIVSNVSTVL